MKKILIFVFFLLPGNGVCARDLPRAEISMHEAENLSLDYSPRLRSLSAQKKSLFKMMDASLAPLRPSINLDGSFKRISKVAEVDIPALGGKTLKLGDNENYSIGPSLNWLLYDFGAARFNYHSARHIYLAKKSEMAALKNKILLSARLSYFNVKLALDRAVFLRESLNLAEAQYNDINLRYKEGAADKLDALGARQEVLSRKSQFRQARSAMAAAMREFAHITGFGKKFDLRFPADERLYNLLSKDDDAPTLILKLDSAAKIKVLLEKIVLTAPSASHPSVRVFSDLKNSHESGRKSLESQRLPKLNLFAKSSLDYPNGFSLETVNQNIFGLNFSMPLFEGRLITRKIESKTAEMKYAEEKKIEAINDINLEWEKAKDYLDGLSAQSDINKEALKNAKELALLTYISYKAGRATFIKVEDSNLKVLNWKIKSLETEMRILKELAVIISISNGEAGKGREK